VHLTLDDLEEETLSAFISFKREPSLEFAFKSSSFSLLLDFNTAASLNNEPRTKVERKHIAFL
jgi:hypothetical protein